MTPAQIFGRRGSCIRALLTAGTLAAGLIAGPVVHSAAAAEVLSGPTTFAFTGAAFSEQGIRVDAIAPTKRYDGEGSPRYVLATTSGAFEATTTTVRHAGGLVLRRKQGGRRRTIRLTAIELRLGRNPVVRAKVGGRPMDLLSLDLRPSDYTVQRAGAVVRIGNARGSLTRPAAAAIGRALRIGHVRRSSFAVVATTTSSPTSVAGTAPEAAAVPAPIEPPATAVGLSEVAPLRWHVRDSWVRYLMGGEGTTASSGATAGPASADGNIYDFDFTPDGGWYDNATGKGVLRYTGKLAFSYAGHGLQFEVSNPEVEISGAESRVFATFGGAKATAYRGRGELAALELAKASTAGSAEPRFVFDGLPLRLTPWANETLLSGFYAAPDDWFGTFRIGFTNRPA